MLDASPDLTPDPEWLLGSGEADPETLAELLTHEYYGFMTALALALGDELAQAEEAVLKALVDAVGSAYRYPIQMSARAWLVGFLLSSITSCRRTENQMFASFRRNTDRAALRERADAVLQTVFGWSEAESAQACGLRSGQAGRISATEATITRTDKPADNEDVPAYTDTTEDELEAIAGLVAARAVAADRRRRSLNFFKEGLLVGVTILAALVIFSNTERLIPSEPERTPTTRPTSGPSTATPLWLDNVAYVAEYGDTLASIAALTGMTVADLQALNDIKDAKDVYPGRPLWIKVPQLPTKEEQPPPMSFLERIKPVSPSSDLAAIRKRIRDGRRTWRSLWADYQMAAYIPLNRNGEDVHYYRFQVWVSRPGRSSELFGDLSNQPVFRHIILDGRNFNSAVMASTAYMDSAWNQPPEVIVYSPVLRELIFPDEPELLVEGFGFLRQIGNTTVAGRDAIILEWRSAENEQAIRYSVDAFSGLLLRRQVLDPRTNQITSDILATEILYNIPIPEYVFDPRFPWRGGFVKDLTNRMVPFDEKVPAPTQAFHPLRVPGLPASD